MIDVGFGSLPAPFVCEIRPRSEHSAMLIQQL